MLEVLHHQPRGFQHKLYQPFRPGPRYGIFNPFCMETCSSPFPEQMNASTLPLEYPILERAFSRSGHQAVPQLKVARLEKPLVGKIGLVEDDCLC